MAEDQKLRAIDMEKEFSKMSQADQYFVRKLNRVNLKRAERHIAARKRNFWMGMGIALGVIGIYTYTMYAVRQEKFLEDTESLESPSTNL